MMLLSDLVYNTKDDLNKVLDGYRAKGTEVDVTLKYPMCPELFVDELEIGLNILDMDSFVSYKDTGKLDLLVMCRLYEMLDWYAAADPDGASLAAESLMRKLEELDTDDDVFPEYEIEELSKYLKRLPPDYKPEEPPAPEPPVELNPLFDCLPNSAEEDDDSEPN